MFIRLIRKEVGYLLKGLTIYVFIVITLLFYFTEFKSEMHLQRLPTIEEVEFSNKALADAGVPVNPFPYGVTEITEPVERMKAIYELLFNAAKEKEIYATSILGINVRKRLSDKEIRLIVGAMNKIATPHIDIDDFLRDEGDYGEQVKISYLDLKEILPILSYEEFESLISEINESLGGNTFLKKEYQNNWINRPRTYEEALSDYIGIIETDMVTQASARLYCDYMGIAAGFLPIFLAAFILTRDRKSRMSEIIYSRQASSFKYILAKYCALCSILFAFFLFLAVIATYDTYSMLTSQFDEIKFIFFDSDKYINILDTDGAVLGILYIDIMAFIKYTVLWIFPTIMITVSIGFVVSCVSSSGLAALPIQIIIWGLSISPLIGSYPLYKAFIRFNAFGESKLFNSLKSDILLNRIFISFISILLILLTVVVFDKKRSGGGFNARYFRFYRTSHKEIDS